MPTKRKPDHIVANLKPKDEAEALLAAQIAIGQVWTMRMAAKVANARGAIQEEMYVGMYGKTARVLAGWFEALKRQRTGGEQKITVQHVQNVAVDGPAIVGNVTQTGSKPAAEPIVSPPALTHDPQPTTPIVDQSVGTPASARARRRRK
jgi:hypothetical protein